MKKSYNPFKMWGSWVGGIILGLISGIVWLLAYNGIIEIQYDLWLGTFLAFGILLYGSLGNTAYILNIIILFIIGFLLGWAIHSIVRAVRRK